VKMMMNCIEFVYDRDGKP